MARRKRILLTALGIVALGIVVWAMCQPSDPLFRGKRESEWIASIGTRNDPSEIEQWREFGPDGIRILSKGLNKGHGPFEKFYINNLHYLPRFVQSKLPSPFANRTTRMRSAFMLNQLGTNAAPALPALMKSLKEEPFQEIRAAVVACFNNSLLAVINESERTNALPYFIKGIKSRGDSECNNSVIALQFYPKQADIVVPVLMRFLRDAGPRYYLVANTSLHVVATDPAANPDVVPVVIGFLNDKDQQTAMRAARLLDEMGQQPKLAVSALMEATQSKDPEVAASAFAALGGFKSETNTTVPVLVKALKDPDGRIRIQASSALRRLDAEAAANAQP